MPHTLKYFWKVWRSLTGRILISWFSIDLPNSFSTSYNANGIYANLSSSANYVRVYTQLTLCIFQSALYFFHQLACLTSAPIPLLMVSCTPVASSMTAGWLLTSVKKLNTTGSSWPVTVTGSVTIHDPLLQRINLLHLYIYVPKFKRFIFTN